MNKKSETIRIKEPTKVRGNIIRAPHSTEKASMLSAEQNAYVFKVYDNANKTEIAKEVAMLYGVHVKSVRIVRIHSKKRRRKTRMGAKPGYKKAIVRVKQGETIETASA